MADKTMTTNPVSTARAAALLENDIGASTTTNRTSNDNVQKMGSSHNGNNSISNATSNNGTVNVNVKINNSNGERHDENQREFFPRKLHMMLEQVEVDGLSSIVSWLPCGTMFKVHQKEAFASIVLPAFFRTTNHRSFQRNLNLWGFQKVNNTNNDNGINENDYKRRNNDKNTTPHSNSSASTNGARYHPYFIRHQPNLCIKMKRVKIKGKTIDGGMYVFLNVYFFGCFSFPFKYSFPVLAILV